MATAILPEPLESLRTPLEAIRPDPTNPKLHDSRQIEAIAASFLEFGQDQPIVVDAEGVIAKGEGRYLAAKRLEWEDAAVLFVDDDELKRVRRNLADNRTHEMTGYDDEMLLALLRQVTDEENGHVPGFDDAYLEQLLAEVARNTDEPEVVEDGGGELHRADELREQWGVEPGQLWEIPSVTAAGQAHRLLCGDCTDAELVRRLMNTQRAVLFATDPPYLVDYDGTNHPHKWGEEDKNKDWSEQYHDWDSSEQGEELYDGFVSVAVTEAITETAAWYCWHASRNQAMLEAVWERYGAFVHQQIVWVKDRAVLTRSWYMWQHEPCFFGWKKGNKPRRTADDYPPTVWQIPTIAPGQTTDHPTSKPVEVFAIPMRQHTVAGDICYEPFAGSGSQFVAGEQLGRIVYGLEINPSFVAVTLQRLKDAGLEPQLVQQTQAPG